jgi:ParB family transcriptional regulator, chromosome partitioning protein
MRLPSSSATKRSAEQKAETIRTHGVLEPLLVRPCTERGFEIVFGARRYRAAQLAEAETVPVRIKQMSDAEVLEAQIIENLQREDIHPMQEAESFKRLLDLEEPKYSIEQIAAKTGKSPTYVAQRLKLNELTEPVIDAFYRNEVGVGHALLLAKLPADKQDEALKACFREDWAGSDRKAKRILLPVRNLQTWIEQNILLLLKDAPFDKRDAHLVAIAGSCVDCPNRTGHNKLLFADLGKQDACADPRCYQAKVDAHVAKVVAEKPKLVQISTSYNSKPAEGSTVVPRGKYVALHEEKPKDKEQAQRPEYKTCRFVTEAIIADGEGKGTTHKVCANHDCPIHHPKKQRGRNNNADANFKVEQEKHRREEAIANTTGIRVLAAIGDAVPVRLMKRDLVFVVERLAGLLDENRLIIIAKQHGIKKAKDSDSIGKLFATHLRRAEESVLGRLVVELTIILSAARTNAPQVLRDAASVYNVNTDAIALKVKQEFAAKEKARTEKKPPVKTGAVKKNASAKKAA